MNGVPSNRAVVENALSSIAPPALVGGLLTELDEIEARYASADYRPSELSGGRFGEFAFRICEHVVLGQATPIGKQLPRTDLIIAALEKASAPGVDDTFRIHIPRSLRLIYDLRSKRDVAHLGGGVTPNLIDSKLVVTIAHWVTAEITRVAHKCDLVTAQRTIDAIVQREVPLVWTDGIIVRILKQELEYHERALLVLFRFFPKEIGDDSLCKAVECSTLGNFRNRVLKPLHKAANIDYRDGNVRLLPPGFAAAIQIAKQAAATA